MSKLLILFILGFISHSCNAGEAISFSTLAHKLRGVCPLGSKNSSKEYCVTSATNINPENITTQFSDFPENHFIKVKLQNHIMLTELVHRAFYDTQPPEHKPEFGFQHLASSFSIYSKACPHVSAEFLQKVYHMFAFLHWKTAVDRTEFLAKSHSKWITRLLNNCIDKMVPLPFLKDVCGERTLSIKDCNSSSFICTKEEHEFRLKKSDPLLDAVFKVFELTQSVCFPFFNESYRMFHFFHLAVMDTFTDDMKIRWTSPVEDLSFYKRLLGPGVQSQLINMERCNEATIAAQKFNFRIRRNSVPARIRLSGGSKRV